MNLFLVVLDRITISSPSLQTGHGTRPFLGEFVPKIMYFFSFGDQDKKPLLSRYCTISFLKLAVPALVVLTTCRLLADLFT